MIYYVDGSSSFVGNQIAITDKDGNLLLNKKFRKKLTNNEVEYEAILAALEMANAKDTIYSDSKLCTEQIMGTFKIKQEHLKPYAQRAKKILEAKPMISIIWKPRGENLAGHFLEKLVKSYARKRNKKSKALRRVNSKKV